MNHSPLKYVVAAILLVVSSIAFAQEVPVSNVSGIVTDSLYTPVDYAVIQLFSLRDSTLSFGTITSVDGTYIMKGIPHDRYNLKISSIGYQPEAKEVDLSEAQKNVSLGLTRLKAYIYQLEGVEVKAGRTGITDRADRIVFVPDSAALRVARTGADVLNKIPEVRVDKKDNTVKVLGNKNVLVLINGADNKRDVTTIPPGDIERVEVITDPSVRYQSDIASVINIVLKGYRQKGFALSSNLYAGLDKKDHSGNIQLDYNIGKWHFFTSYIGNFKKTETANTTNRLDYDENNTDQYLSSPISNNYDVAFNRFQYGADYSINEKNFLSFTSRVVSMNVESFRHNIIFSSTNDEVTEQSEIKSSANSDKTNQNYSLYYSHLGKKEKQKLEINTNYFCLNEDSHHFIDDSTVAYPSGDSYITSRIIFRDYKQHSLNTKVDYSMPVTNNVLLEYGYQFYGRKIKSEATATETEDSNISYHDYRNSGYLNATYEPGKWNFQLGARVEDSKTKVNGIKNNQTKFLPYGLVFYKPDANNSFRLTYRNALEYPVYSYLNPFRYYSSDSLSYSAGNPDLKPERSNSLILNYSLRGKSTHLSLTLNYDHLNNLIAQKVSLENSVLAYCYDNVGKARRYGAVFSLSSSLFDVVDVDLLLRGNYTDFLARKTHSGYSYAAELDLYTPLVWGIDLEVSGVFKEREINYNGYEQYGTYIEEILLSRDITKNLFLGFAVRNPFIIPKDKDKTWGSDFVEIDRTRELHTPTWLFNLTFYLRSGKNTQRRNTDSYMENPQGKGKQMR